MPPFNRLQGSRVFVSLQLTLEDEDDPFYVAIRPVRQYVLGITGEVTFGTGTKIIGSRTILRPEIFSEAFDYAVQEVVVGAAHVLVEPLAAELKDLYTEAQIKGTWRR